jgi:hypothetical protein
VLGIRSRVMRPMALTEVAGSPSSLGTIHSCVSVPNPVIEWIPSSGIRLLPVLEVCDCRFELPMSSKKIPKGLRRALAMHADQGIN